MAGVRTVHFINVLCGLYTLQQGHRGIYSLCSLCGMERQCNFMVDPLAVVYESNTKIDCRYPWYRTFASLDLRNYKNSIYCTQIKLILDFGYLSWLFLQDSSACSFSLRDI